MEALAIAIAIEGLVIMTLLAYKVLRFEKRAERPEPEEENPEAKKQSEREESLQKGLDAIQNYDIRTAMEVIRNNGADRDE